MSSQDKPPSYGPGGRGFYGAVTVSERGQIAIPAQARRDLGIEPGDKLLVLGDPEQGLALTKLDLLMRNLQSGAQLLEKLQQHAATGPARPDADPEDQGE